MRLARSEIQLETWLSRIEGGELDLQPDFQRQDIWDRKRQQRLIDSILREWYVPAVHIVHVSENNNPSDVVLDGQQRLTAIRDFARNVFPIAGQLAPPSGAMADLNGLKYRDLPAATARRFRRFILTCVTLYEYEPDEPNELFFRLNQAYNLTPSEKRNALIGEAQQAVKRLVEHLKQYGLLTRESLGFSNDRLAYDDIVARACVAVERGTLRQHINNNSVEEYYRGRVFAPATLSRVARAGETLHHLVRQAELRTRFNKGSLFSWMVFCAELPSADRSAPTLLGEFEETRRLLRDGGEEQVRGLPEVVAQTVRLYDDRVSYRVTDVMLIRFAPLRPTG